MDSLKMELGLICISETVRIERWSGKNERSWHLLEQGKPVAELTFTVNEGLIRVSRLNVESDNLEDDIARQLVLHLQSKYPGQWLEIPSSLIGAIEVVTVGRKINEDRQLAEIILQKFDARMSEAAVVYDHMKKYQWGFRGRMEFYGKFPEFLNREEAREELMSKVDALPEHLVRVGYPAGNVARSI